jgi:hypothetical protein
MRSTTGVSSLETRSKVKASALSLKCVTVTGGADTTTTIVLIIIALGVGVTRPHWWGTTTSGLSCTTTRTSIARVRVGRTGVIAVRVLVVVVTRGGSVAIHAELGGFVWVCWRWLMVLVVFDFWLGLMVDVLWDVWDGGEEGRRKRGWMGV